MEKTDIVFLSVILGFLSSLFQEYGILTILVSSAIVFDIITGILKAKVRHIINSNAGYKGFWKKLSLLAGLAFGFFLDFLEYYLITKGEEGLHINIPFAIPIGMIIGIYIVLNESISICENLHECGVRLPAFLLKALQIAKKSIDNGVKNNK